MCERSVGKAHMNQCKSKFFGCNLNANEKSLLTFLNSNVKIINRCFSTCELFAIIVSIITYAIMKLKLLLGLFMSFAWSAFSQTTEIVNTNIVITSDMVMAKKGTYQIIIYDAKFTPAYTTDILYFIEQNRKPTEDVTLFIEENVVLFIPSESTINKSDFEPLEEIAH